MPSTTPAPLNSATGTPQATGSTPVPAPSKAKPMPTYVMARADCRKLDQLASSMFGMPGVMLMENAARDVATQALAMLKQSAQAGGTAAQTQSVLIFCGPGNNGGDGFAAARHLANAGVRVSILLSTHINRLKGEAALNCSIVQKQKLSLNVVTGEEITGPLEGAIAACVQRPCLIIDALLGTGAERAVVGTMAHLIQEINKLRATGIPVLSVDIPSGLDADTGAPLPKSPAVTADVTVTMAGLKVGFMEPSARAFTGRVVIGDIGVPAELLAKLGEKMVMPEHLHG